MPLVQIKGIADYLTAAQKQELIQRVTEAVVAVEGEGLRPVTWVIIEEVPNGAWGVGGKIVTGQDLKKLAVQAAA